MIANKKLAAIDLAVVIAKAQAGQGLTISEAAVRYGIGLSTMTELVKEPNFPLTGGKIFDADFQAWRQARAGLGVASSHNAGARRSRGTADKPYEYHSKRG